MDNQEQQYQEPVIEEQSTSQTTEENNDLAYFNSDSNSQGFAGIQSAAQQTTPTQPNDLMKAILLAVAFGLIGCVVFGILYYVGYVAFIGAYLIFYFACFGYKKYNNGSIDKKGYIITLVISIVELVITILIALSFVVMKKYPDIGFMNALSSLPDLMEISPEFKGALISDIVISVIFIFVGLLSDVRTARKRAKMRSSI